MSDQINNYRIVAPFGVRGTRIWINDVELKDVTQIELKIGSDLLPALTLTVHGNIIVDGHYKPNQMEVTRIAQEWKYRHEKDQVPEG